MCLRGPRPALFYIVGGGYIMNKDPKFQPPSSKTLFIDMMVVLGGVGWLVGVVVAGRGGHVLYFFCWEGALF